VGFLTLSSHPSQPRSLDGRSTGGPGQPSDHGRSRGDVDLVIQCWHGNTSLDTAGFLIETGWDPARVASVSGGFPSWVEAHDMGSLQAG